MIDCSQKFTKNTDRKNNLVALKSSIAGVISTVNRKECFRQRRAYLVAELAELDAELAAINESERDVVGVESGESRSSKRRRK